MVYKKHLVSIGAESDKTEYDSDPHKAPILWINNEGKSFLAVKLRHPEWRRLEDADLIPNAIIKALNAVCGPVIMSAHSVSDCRINIPAEYAAALVPILEKDGIQVFEQAESRKYVPPSKYIQPTTQLPLKGYGKERAPQNLDGLLTILDEAIEIALRQNKPQAMHR